MNIEIPGGLQNKVQFDMRLYFFCWESENMDMQILMHKMTKVTKASHIQDPVVSFQKYRRNQLR